MEVILNSKNFDQEVLKSDKPVIVDFFSPMCGPCKLMAPIFEKVAKELSSKYKFGKLDITIDQETATKYSIQSVPTFLFVKNGKVIGKETGYMKKDELVDKINKFFGK